MRGHAVWFAVGTATGLYASVKARRAAYRLSMPGLIDQAAALGTGWRAFSAEMRDGMAARERDLVAGLALEPVETAHADALAASPSMTKDDPDR